MQAHDYSYTDSNSNKSWGYTIRSLEESEIDTWADFCAAVFAYKASPPSSSYFKNHYYNDPWRQALYVRVAVYQEQIVASVRIFQRKVSLGKGDKLLAGGIGEVCTDTSHRRRGLSKVLLQDAICIMQEAQIQVSFLHAAPSFFPVYQSVGYQNTKTVWTNVPIQSNTLQNFKANSNLHYRIRSIDFTNDLLALAKMYKDFSESNFTGCIIRSEGYWKTYIANEIGTKARVLVNANNDRILGWMAIRYKNEKWTLQDYGSIQDGDLLYTVFCLLIKALEENVENKLLHLLMPNRLCAMLQESWNTSKQKLDNPVFDFDSVIEEVDRGWMYKSIASNVDVDNICNASNHFIWPSDSF